MCGFCGFTGQIVDRESYLRQMTERITHRGPDADGYYLDDTLAMGFRRLSIIDLEAAQQPLYNEDKSLALMFNGEIYNYRELRQQLQQLGHTFATAGDGETLLHGYEQWGHDLLPRLRVQGNIVQNGLIRGVTKVHVVKYHLSLQLGIAQCAVAVRMLPRPEAGSLLGFPQLAVFFLCVH